MFENAASKVARIDRTGKGFFNGGTQIGPADLAEFVPTTGATLRNFDQQQGSIEIHAALKAAAAGRQPWACGGQAAPSADSVRRMVEDLLRHAANGWRGNGGRRPGPYAVIAFRAQFHEFPS